MGSWLYFTTQWDATSLARIHRRRVIRQRNGEAGASGRDCLVCIRAGRQVLERPAGAICGVEGGLQSPRGTVSPNPPKI